MKNQFNARRFALLFRKHTSENYKAYLMSLVVLVGAMFVIMGAIAYMSGEPLTVNIQGALFAFFLMATGTVYSSTVFSSLGESKKAISYLTLPASTLEKYLVGWVYSFLLFSVVFFAAFYVAAGTIVHLDTRSKQAPELINIFTRNSQDYLIYVLYAFVNAIALVGAIFFKKGHFIKTAFLGFIAVFLVAVLNKISLEMLLGRKLTNAMPFGKATFNDESNSYFTVELPETQAIMLVYMTMAIIIWVAAYYKLKEKQL
jgi:hypothetical protein